MLTKSRNKETTSSQLMDQTKTHQMKQLEMYQNNAKMAMAAA